MNEIRTATNVHRSLPVDGLIEQLAISIQVGALFWIVLTRSDSLSLPSLLEQVLYWTSWGIMLLGALVVVGTGFRRGCWRGCFQTALLWMTLGLGYLMT